VTAAASGEPARAEGGPGADGPRPAVMVLADRLAAGLATHEPGWRLPRHSALDRRYSVTTGQIDAAISELVGRHLIRRLPDGQLYRVSPVEYLIPLEGVPGLGSRIDLMGGELTCRSRQTSWRRVREEISCALGVDPGEPICVVRAVWDASGEPAAYATTYLTSGPEVPDPPWGELVATGKPAALQVEMQLPPPSVARSLRLSPVQPAAMVTVRFDDPDTGAPVALTVAVLRTDLFRVVVQTADQPVPGDQPNGFSAAWAHVAQDWES
jgi:DNA-binding GntR family transcriptional regulator